MENSKGKNYRKEENRTIPFSLVPFSLAGKRLMPLYPHSRLETYENCPQQYKLRYIDCFEISPILTKLKSLNELINYYEEQWDKN